jgi:hypothetical protein
MIKDNELAKKERVFEDLHFTIVIVYDLGRWSSSFSCIFFDENLMSHVYASAVVLGLRKNSSSCR